MICYVATAAAAATSVDIVNPVSLTCDTSINYATFWSSVQQRLL